MALIAIWMVSIENRSILFRRYFPSNGTKTSDGKMVAMLTMKEESQFVSGLMSSLGIDSSFSNASNSDSEYSFSFDCTQINQLPALGFNLKGYKLWPIIVLEHKGILFCGLPVVNNTSSNLIDHIGVSVTVSTLHSLINHFSKDNRLFLLEDYFTKNLPFGSQITNPYELEDDTFNKTDSETKASTSSSSTSSSKQELVLTVRITEFISSSEPDNEMIHGTVYITNNIVFSGNPLLTYRVDNLNELNPILSPHCWLNNSNFSSSISSSSSSTSSSPASVSSSSFSCICSKLNSKALRFFHYKCNPGLISEPFIQYNYCLTRKSDLISHLDLSITIKKANLMRFHSFRINFNRLPQSIISRLSNCAPSQGQLHMDKQNGFYWIVGTKIPKSGKLRLNADINCQTLSADQFDASANFRVDNYTHGYPRPRGENFTLSDNLYSINFKLTPQLTLATFDYRLKATLI